MPPRGLFITGTDTDVGKTRVAVAIIAALARQGLRVGIAKPVASGCPDAAAPGGDPMALWEAAGRPRTPADVCPQAFAAPLAPRAAARLEGRDIDERLLRTAVESWQQTSDVVVVEGAGGLLSPLGSATLNADLARDLALPLVIVDRARLGLVGRTLATARAAAAEGLVVAAVVVSWTHPPAGEPTDPTGDERIVTDGLADLRHWLPGVPIGVLGHGGTTIAPAIDWRFATGIT
jgi:dethiobiotin synthetase